VSRYTTKNLIRLFVLIVSVVFFGADLSVSAQNANSSTTPPDNTMTENTNTNTNMNRGRRRRRGRRRSSTAMPADTASTETVTLGSGPVAQIPVQTGRCDPNAQEQTDLSGTYTGTANYAEGGLSGEATLTINGNDFTITSGSSTQEGRVTAVTTCNYTAVTMMFGKPQTSAAKGDQPAPLPAVSLRARRMGRGLSLESVGGGTRQFSFSSAGGGGRGGRNSSPRVGIKPPTAHAR
jgi:hypothetical protein